MSMSLHRQDSARVCDASLRRYTAFLGAHTRTVKGVRYATCPYCGRELRLVSSGRVRTLFPRHLKQVAK